MRKELDHSYILIPHSFITVFSISVDLICNNIERVQSNYYCTKHNLNC